MNQFFLDSIPDGLIFVKEGAVAQYNKTALELFPKSLADSQQDIQWLADAMPGTCGEVEIAGSHYRYVVLEQDGETSYRLERVTYLSSDQIDHVLATFRNHLVSLYIAWQDVVEENVDDQRFMHADSCCRVNQAMVRMQRLLENCNVVQGAFPKLEEHPLDIGYAVDQLRLELNNLFPRNTILFDAPQETIVCMGSLVILRRVLMGLISNSRYLYEQISLRLHKNKDHAFIQVKEVGAKPLTQSISDILEGKQSDPGNIGAGLGMLAIQKMVASYHCQLWVEEAKEGGLVLTIAVPLADEKAVKLFLAGEWTGPRGIPVDVDGENSDLVTHLSPVLPRNFFSPEDLL